MRICVFGAGSLGSAIGGILAQDHDVVLVGRKRHVDAVRKNGLKIVGDFSGCFRVEAFENADRVGKPNLLIISTKAYDTAQAIRASRRLVGAGTMVLTLQNGLGNLELLRTWVGNKAFGGTTTLGAALISPGVVRISGLGLTTIGSDADANGAQVIAAAFRSCGIRVNVEKDVMREIWGKAVVNACINPTAAVLGVRNGMLLKSPTIAHFMRDVSLECERVAAASRVNLHMTHMYPRVREVCRDTADNVSSMLQDVQKGKRTEIQQINGAFCSMGEARAVPTPLNETLVSMVECMHSTKEKG